MEGCFIRSADDAIAVKGLDPTMDTRDVVVRDSVLFPHGNCMEIGFELFNNAVRNVTFERNVCLHQVRFARTFLSETHRVLVCFGANESFELRVCAHLWATLNQRVPSQRR